MRVAIISDIHGNSLALKAVLEHIQTQQIDQTVCAGDLVAKGPEPAEALGILRANQIPSVYGNTDLDVLDQGDEADTWVFEQLSTEELDFIRQLPLSLRITPQNGRSPEDDLLIVHSTPRSCFEILILQPHPNGIGERLQIITPEEEVVAMLAGERANLMIYGHIHFISEGMVRGQRIASIGSVGLPFDGDHRAAYAVAEWDGGEWKLEHHRVPYDHVSVEQTIRQSEMPMKNRWATMIRRAQWLPYE